MESPNITSITDDTHLELSDSFFSNKTFAKDFDKYNYLKHRNHYILSLAEEHILHKQVINFKKGKLDEQENLVKLNQNYFRIQISNPKKRSPLSTKRFYGDVIKADNRFMESYRKYKTTKLSALKVINIHLDLVGITPVGGEEEFED